MLELVVALGVTGVLRCTHVKGEDPNCKIYYLVLGSSRKISCFSSTVLTHSLPIQPLETHYNYIIYMYSFWPDSS